jgi:tetratricopeptide (TPR) repeat protein
LGPTALLGEAEKQGHSRNFFGCVISLASFLALGLGGTTMECPKITHHSTLIAGLFISAGLGCTQSQTVIPKDAVPPNAKIAKAEDLPKRDPKPSTSVAFGNLHLQAAIDGSVQGAEREASLEQARKSYNQAIKTDAKCMDAYRGLAQVEQNCGNYQGALAWYRKGLAVDAKQAQLYYEMGICQARHGDWAAAQDSISKACDLDADNRIYVKTLAFCLGKNGRYDDSIACFKRVMDEGQAHYNLARLLHHDNHDDLSRLHIQLALQANPKLTQAQDFLAQMDGRQPGANPTNVASASAPNVGIDIDDITSDLPQSPGSAN